MLKTEQKEAFDSTLIKWITLIINLHETKSSHEMFSSHFS